MTGQDFDTINKYWSDQVNNEIYLKERPDIARGSKEYFDFIIAQRNKYNYYYNEIDEFFGRNQHNKSLLEVGCGIGVDLVRFAHQGFTVTGIDLAETHIALAKECFKLYGLKGDLTLGNAETLKFADGSFDRVYSFGVLHHTPHPARAIDEVYRVLRPGGRAFIMLYHKHSLNNLLHLVLRRPFENPKKSVNISADAPYTHRFTKMEVRAMCNPFSAVDIRTRYLYGAGYGLIYELTPTVIYRALSKLVGWHLAIYLIK